MSENEHSIGVIVARFQVAELTEGHKELLDFVLAKGHNQNVIFLGVAPTKATKNNPLDYDSRRRMIEEAYPGDFTILFQEDRATDQKWSEELDDSISVIANGRDVVMYGSRDSFGAHYFGKYEFCEVPQHVYCSGTDQRFLTGKSVISSSDWRKGCIYATQNRYPTVYPAVDCAIFDDDKFEYVYLAKKAGETLYRFVGGFSDPKDASFEAAAKREAQEETGLETEVLGWVGSIKVDDWRYRGEIDKIITNFFAMKRVFGVPKANDDICELRKVKFAECHEFDIIKEHRPLWIMLKDWVAKRQKYVLVPVE